MIAWTALLVLLSVGSLTTPTSPVQVWGGKNGSKPVAVSGLSSAVTDIQAANWGGLAIQAGNVYQWTNSKHPTATEVIGPQNIVSIGEGGGHQYGAAVTSTSAKGKVWTWGSDADGQLCNGTTNPTKVFPPSKVDVPSATEVSGGQEHLEFLTTDNQVVGCGNNEYGQLGDATNTNSSIPVTAQLQLQPGVTITEISAGNQFTLALDSSGNVWAWGENDLGQLGDGSTTNSNVPVQVALPSPAVQIYAGGSQRNPQNPNGSGIARLANGDVYAWGDDQWDQLGESVSTTCPGPPGQSHAVPCSVSPVQVQGLPSGVAYVAMGGADSFLLTTGNVLYGWGDNTEGQMGTGKCQNPPCMTATPTVLESGVTQISAVAQTVEALNASG